MDLETALQAISAGPHNDEEVFRLAAEYLVDHRDLLKHRVFIDIPDPNGRLTTNLDAKWTKIKEGSTARCACGNERIIMPLTMRSEFVGIIGEQIVLTVGQQIYIKPLGGDKQSTYLNLVMVKKNGDLYAALYINPFDQMINLTTIFDGPSAVRVPELIEEAQEDGDLVLYMHDSNFEIPILKFVGATKDSLSIRLDTAVEAFQPETARLRHQHQLN